MSAVFTGAPCGTSRKKRPSRRPALEAMLAADKLLLRSQVKQNLIVLREKELNLFNSNFSAVATQAALLAGFSMAFLEMSVHLKIDGEQFHPIPRACLHAFATISICANIFVVSLITFVSVWGSGKALRGKDGSMGKVVSAVAATTVAAPPSPCPPVPPPPSPPSGGRGHEH